MLCKSRKSLRKDPDLPPEVLEIVFAFLPEHAVCRFRVVCKAWNHLILQPGFASLRALTPRQASSILISPKLMARAPHRTWCVLDAVENRTYKVPDNGFVWMLPFRQYKYTLAADGGLIYTMYSNALWSQSGQFLRRASRVHIVCNPVSKSFHKIPEPQFYCSYNYDVVVMSVDNVTKAYKIVTMESRNNELHLYDSTTSVWKVLCTGPKDCVRAHSSIFMNDTFYTVFEGFEDHSGISCLHSMLYSCNLETGARSKIDVHLLSPSNGENQLRLVVSLNRLFIVEHTRLGSKTWVTLSIWEIVLGKKEAVQVGKMHNFYKYSMEMFVEAGDEVVAVGCADSIVILSSMGRCVKFDLSEKCWQELPTYTKDIKHDSLCRGMCTGLVDV